ncbi:MULTISPECIES: O-antigen ligase family protein [unclassified Moraxella]|uniref:PglL family O-oligosaccharyltransferase n=1 Tax=unclassified Moraxella TaxID=2685852 RepID=UPI003AF97E44
MSLSAQVTAPHLDNDNSRWFALCMGLAVLCYLAPWHSPLGRDFLVNAMAFFPIVVGVIGFLLYYPIRQISLSVGTWLALAVLLGCQPLLHTLAYPDALIFPIACLFMVAMVAMVAGNVTDKSQLLNRFFIAVYVMALLTFFIQFSQMQNYQGFYKGWVIVRDNAQPNRYDGNFGQANHTAYGFVLALCGVIYQLHQAFSQYISKDTINQDFIRKNARLTSSALPKIALGRYRQLYRFGLMVLFVCFTIGLALTQSRAGLVMMLTVIGVYFFAQQSPWRSKFLLAGFGWVMFLLYYMGTSWIANYTAGGNSLGAVSRMAGGQGNRSALSERAMMMFHDHPWTGVGWNHYMSASVDYAQHFKWPEIADHSHNFFTMILAELGVVGALCFVPIVWILLRAIHWRHSAESAIALAFVLASLLYASVEYPLWYFRYLAVFALFLALIDQSNWRILPKKWLNCGVMGILSLLAGGAGFYTNTYLAENYLNYDQFVSHKNHQFQDNKMNYQAGVFGFSAYHDRILAMQAPVTAVQLDKKREIFQDVLTSDSSQFNLLANAQLYAYQGDKAKAFELIQASCIMVRDLTDCDNVDTDLENFADRDPATFGDLYTQFVQWRKANPSKTGLETGK